MQQPALEPPPHVGSDSPLSVDEVMKREKAHLEVEQGLSALCFSGGGMRSATFCLGFLRGFRELLPQFHYLSTVSGGGYAGAWVCHLARTLGWRKVIDDVLNPGTEPAPQITHLRRYSDLFETRSWLSAAALRLASAYLRSLTIWWLLYIPLLLLAALVPWVVLLAERWFEGSTIPHLAALAGFVVWGGLGIRLTERFSATSSSDGEYRPRLAFASAALVATILLAAFVDYGFRISVQQLVKQDPFAVDFGFWLIAISACFGVSVLWGAHYRPKVFAALTLSLALGWALADLLLASLPDSVPQVYPLKMLLFAAASWLAGAFVVGAHGRDLEDADRETAADLMGTAATICIVVVSASALALGATWLMDRLGAEVRPILAGTSLAGAVTAVLSFRSRIGQRVPAGWRRYATHLATLLAVLFGVTLWVIASRLLTAIEPELLKGLSRSSNAHGAVVLKVVAVGAALTMWSWWWSRTIGVNAFSLNGLYRVRLVRAFLRAPAQNPPTMEDPPLAASPGPRFRPIHLINAVVNDSGTTRLEWRDRRAEPFVFSPLFCGSKETRFLSSGQFSDGTITLGRAIAISGAAANPNMGHFSSRPVQWLMAFFNLRLGWWLANPKFSETALDVEPRHALTPYGEELLGRSGVDSTYLNLSDGGHFENLGLYEAIRRQCEFIVAVDASHDPDGAHEDLARAERLIRIDFGAELEWRVSPQVGHYRVAKITYRDKTHGHLVYVKPELTGNEPADVLAYAQQARDRGDRFPHESTSDLWFDEAQFESYMKLGQHSAEAVLKDMGSQLNTALPFALAAIAGLTVPVADVRNQEVQGIPADPILAPVEPLALPMAGEAAAETSWWKPLVKPVAASLVATTSVIGISNLISERNDRERTDRLNVSRVSTVVDSREQSFLLPWFDEGRPTPDDMALVDRELSALRTELARLNNAARTNVNLAGAPLRPADIDRLERLAGLLKNDRCQPIEVRGLASSSQIAVPDETTILPRLEQAELEQCGHPTRDAKAVSDCRNVRLANRRAEFIRALLTKADVALVDFEPWNDSDPLPMFDAQYDDQDPAEEAGAPAPDRYIARRGAFNRSVEIIPRGASCDFDAIQRRLGVMVVDRPY